MNRVKDKVAIVTGAGQGLGKAVSVLLAKEGARVVVTARSEQAGQSVVDEIRLDGGEGIFVRHDVADEASWQALMERVVSEFGRLDVLVNNAAVFHGGSIVDTPLEKWREVMSVNLDGTFLGVKYAIRVMKASGGGSIVNVASIGGRVGLINGTPYCASKGGVMSFTQAAALECSRAGYDYGIRLNCVLPGWTKTRMLEPVMSNERAYKKQLSGLPVGRFGEPEEVAYAVLFLASDESSFVTGTELVVDGGWTAQ